MESAQSLTARIRALPYPWLFLPLFVFYLLFIGISSKSHVRGDEPRYLRYATNLTNGFYANPDDLEFISGPGYPLFLAPFVAVGLPLKGMHLLNAFLLIGAIWFFFQTLSLYLPRKHAFWVSYLLGLYPFTLQYITYAYSEALSILLSTAFIYFYCVHSRQEKFLSRELIWGILALGFLILTKVIFAYVAIGFSLAGVFFGLLFKVKAGRSAALMGLGAFVMCIPYLVYTYSLTGKTMYWSTSGGQQLYFHASPFEHEWGNWYSDYVVWHPEVEPKTEVFTFKELSKNHIDFYKTLPYRTTDSATVTLERDLMFKEKAKEYMQAYPKAFIKNTIASLVRLFFNFPRSYTRQHLGTAKYVFVNMFLVVGMLLSIYPALTSWKKIPAEIWALTLFLSLFIGGLSLLNGWPRHLIPVLPIFLLYLAFIYTHIVDIRINKSNGY